MRDEMVEDGEEIDDADGGEGDLDEEEYSESERVGSD